MSREKLPAKCLLSRESQAKFQAENFLLNCSPDAASCRAHCKDKWKTPYFTWHGEESYWGTIRQGQTVIDRNGVNLFPQFATVPFWRSILHIPLVLDITLYRVGEIQNLKIQPIGIFEMYLRPILSHFVNGICI